MDVAAIERRSRFAGLTFTTIKIQMSLLAKILKDSLPQFDLVIKRLSVADLFYLLDVSFFFPEERGLLTLQRPQIL